MIEKHPFKNFIPQNACYLILGSFAGRITDDSYDWFYSNRVNLFWPIIREVYGKKLLNKGEKQKLFADLGIAMADIILSCERKMDNNEDTNLTNIVINKKLKGILSKNKIRKIFFSSRFVENLFRKHFKDLIIIHSEIELITLPSPSPRFAKMTKAEKIVVYAKLLPKL